MNDITQEQTKSVKIYREFFFKAQEDISNQLLKLKSCCICNGCRKCCQIRYSTLSPDEMKKSANEEFIKNFLPLGAEKENDVVDFQTNQYEAFRTDMEYAQRAIDSTDKDVWFYGCRFYQSGACKKGKEKPIYCNSYPQNVTAVLHENCAFRKWQNLSLTKLENEMSKDILEKIHSIDEYKKNFDCARCATCCKFACSEFSYEELLLKAKNGDKFATQFTSVFVPYENQEDAKKIYADYVEYMKETLPESENYYFYYCPKNKDNLCTDYENRPEICREFPTNPLMILPKICGYKPWQEETHTATLLLHALVEIVGFYIEKLKKIN